MNAETAELIPESLSELWDFSDQSTSGKRFVQFRERAINDGLIELAALAETQLARSLGLDRKFDAGFAILDEVDQRYPDQSGELAVRVQLERGRLLNSSGKQVLSIPLFTGAWEESLRAGLDALAVDAAHMLGIVLDGEVCMEWNEKALKIAMTSSHPAAQKWKGSLLNNMGWAYHSTGNYTRAMELFEQALEFRIIQGASSQIRIARWSIGRCFRSMGQLDVAISVQRSLEMDPDADGYVFEELGECLQAQGNVQEAKPYFAKAYSMLSQDAWFVANETERLDRLKVLGQ